MARHRLRNPFQLRRDDIVEKSIAGILIPDTAAKEKSKVGVVIAVGPGRMSDEGKLIPMNVKVGSKVFFLQTLCVLRTVSCLTFPSEGVG